MRVWTLLVGMLLALPVWAGDGTIRGGATGGTVVSSLSKLEQLSSADTTQTLILTEVLGADVEAALIGVADSDATTTDTVIHDPDPTHGSISADLVGQPMVIMDSAAGVTRGEHALVASVDAGADTVTLDRALTGTMDGATYRIGAAVTLAPGDLSDGERLTIRCEGGGFLQNQDDSVSPPVLIHRDDTNIEHDSEVVSEGCNYVGTCSDAACTDGKEDVFSIAYLHTGIGTGNAGRTYFFRGGISNWTAGATTGNLSTHVHGDRFYLLDGPTNSVGDQVYMSDVFIDAVVPFEIHSTLNRFQVTADALVNSNTSTGTADASPLLYATADMDDVLIISNVIEGLNYMHFQDVYVRVIGTLKNPGSSRLAPPGGAFFSLDSGAIDLSLSVDHFLPILHPAGTGLIDVRSGGTVPVSIRARVDDPRCVFAQSGTPINLVDADASGAGIKNVSIDWVDGDDCEPIVAPLSSQAETELTSDARGFIRVNGQDTYGPLSRECRTQLATRVNPTEAGATDDFLSLFDGSGSTTEADEDDRIVDSRLRTVHSLYCEVDVAPGAGNDDWRVVLRDDGSDTSLTCDIAEAATSCEDTANAPRPATGSLINLDVNSDVGGGTDPDAAGDLFCTVCLGP